MISVAIPVLTAPTAAGKSELALKLAEQVPLEIVSADAFNVYRGMDIGTAKPDQEARARVPHHLLDLREPFEPYDVAQFVQDAEVAIAGILERGRAPLVVGGTGFYLQALVRGLPLTPPANPVVQAEVERELAERGLDALLLDMAAVNPAEAARMERNPRRVVRALEVWRRTGRFPGAFGHSTPRFRYQVIAFTRPPEELEARVRGRVHAMFGAGLVDEVRSVLNALPPTDRRPTAWQAIGYREVEALLRGERTPEQTEQDIVVATLAYAKRQLTWIRTQLKAPLLTPEEAESKLLSVLNKGRHQKPAKNSRADLS